LKPNQSDSQAARSLDALLRERLQAALDSPSASGNRLEQIALFSRWYYSSWRDGHWFGFETLDQLNYRRLVKSLSELSRNTRKTVDPKGFQGQAPAAESVRTAVSTAPPKE
jgi:hypothetical protein